MFQMHLSTVSTARRRAMYACCLLLLGALSACASTPRETASQPVQVRLDSSSVTGLPGLAPRLVSYSDKRTVLMLNPPQEWERPQMRDSGLQSMVDHCSRAGRSIVRVRHAALEDMEGNILATYIEHDDQDLAEFNRHAGSPVALTKAALPGVLRLKLDPAEFHGQFREETEVIFRDAKAQIAPGLYASLESITMTPHQISLSQRTARANYLYIKLSNRSEHSYTLNGHDTGAMEADAGRMLTAPDLHGNTIAPNAALIVRLPLELTQTSLEPGRRNAVALQDYLGGTNGAIGPWIDAMIPLRIQIELKSSDPYASHMQRGLLMPTLQVQKRYLLERAGCFD
jgi:hypothetical protein